jgi:hypothetical protein
MRGGYRQIRHPLKEALNLEGIKNLSSTPPHQHTVEPRGVVHVDHISKVPFF